MPLAVASTQTQGRFEVRYRAAGSTQEFDGIATRTNDHLVALETARAWRDGPRRRYSVWIVDHNNPPPPRAA